MARLEPFAGLDGASRVARPVPPRRMLNLRCDPASEAPARIASAVGVSLPLTANVWTAAGQTVCFWLGPDEWLISAPSATSMTLETDLAAALEDDPWAAVVDVSDAHVGLTLSGPHARDVLARGCPLDLADDRFGADACARTLLGKTGMLLRRVDAAPTFELWVRPSFAGYVRDWLLAVERAALAASDEA